ncbi:MAG: hypothetical protein J6A01_09445 [Proteobacteria bacterium]|nr:hypothetical protein [Pseudomonadota bacterium]
MNTSKKVMIIVGVLLIIGFIIMLAVPSRNDSPQVTFEPLDGQIALLHKAYGQWFGAPIAVLETEPGKAVLCDWLMYRGRVANESEDINDWAEKFNADSMDLAMSKTMSADYWASQTSFDEWVAVFNGDEAKRSEIIARCSTEAPDIAKAIDADIDAFKKFAAKENLLDRSGKLRHDKRDILNLIYRHLWVSLAAVQLPRASIEPPEEKIAFLRWQVEQSAMPLEKKIQKLEEFAQQNNDSYDFLFALSVLYAQNGMSGEACTILQEAITDTDESKETNSFRKERYLKTYNELRQAHPMACH